MAERREWLTKIREAAGYKTTEALAKEIGISASYVCKTEAGIRTPKPPIIHRWGRATGIPENEMLQRFYGSAQ